MRYVIIGNSAAAVGCITGIRKVDKEGEIVVISYEDRCYSKPMIADVLIDYSEEKLLYRGEDFFKKNNVRLMLGSKAVNIDTENKLVVLESKETVLYDKLLISTGAVPFVPPIPGSEKEGVFTFTELNSAKKMKEYLEKNSVERIVVIGSGFIGLEVAYYLREIEKEVVVVELLDRVLGKALDKRGSEIVEKMLREKGVQFKFNDTVEEILGEEKVNSVRLKSGEVLKTEAVVIAIGVRPNVELAKAAGIRVNRGIITDDFMKTNIPDIFAAGDCVECKDITDGIRKNLPLFPLAFEQGLIAGLNMAGKEIEYLGGLPLNSLKFLDKPVLNAGIVEPPDDSYEVLVNDKFDKKGYYRKAILKDGKLVGFVAIGEIDRVGILTNLIRQKIDVSNIKDRLISLDFGLVDLPRDWRREKLEKDKTGYKDWRPVE
ncbi:Rubredoxin--NAD(+) reductase [Desulfurobacterium thermolithotrophum DSM 11699]|uniref:Rubredoxin--NAD(+) reductase n=1 Tax=Desulfurobacterium thermolithotrophum (strain DSM 11699 / BSA) TaxID=868864 RepID=F0S2V3_DESTD|nr:FAD-dependent oxidoreductase [Desulfurobacterium thermolithotrophum]ADY73175.1 Rubredoxin--NAD(+) reductase [Desulfurobacterium thermolithotrophum DSM 11699]